MSVNVGTTTVLGTRLGAAGMSGGNQTLLLRDPKFQELIRQRNGLAIVLSVVTLAIYLAFIFLVAFDKPLLATKVGGGTTSLGIVLGLVVIVAAFVLTAIYVVRANGKFDELTAALVRDYDR